MSRRYACLLGYPVGHSVSPAIHNAAFAALGVDARYLARAVPAEQLGQAVSALRDPAWLGANVTVPHKQAVIPLLDGLADEARTLGAVNTVVRRADGSLWGANTDAAGLARWLETEGAVATIAGGDALILGAGGAARATAMALARHGARSVRLLNRTLGRAATVVAELQPHAAAARLTAGPLAEAAAPGTAFTIVVNATSLGLRGAAPEVHPSRYAAHAWAVELAYNPPETPFMRAARQAGARAGNGLGMLVHQAALSCQLWTGQEPPLGALYAAATTALEQAALVAVGQEPR